MEYRRKHPCHSPFLRPGALLSMLWLLILSAPTLLRGDGKENTPGFYPDPTRGTSLPADQMVRLFSAPLLNQKKIEEAALQYERETRKNLSDEMKQSVRELCRLPVDQARERIRHWRGELGALDERWRNVNLRYERMLAHKLKEGLMEGDYERSMTLREPVVTLKRERHELIAGSWYALFQLMEKRISGKGCDTPPDYGSLLPGERLFLPLYLARFRFYDSLPTEFRIQLFLSLKKG